MSETERAENLPPDRETIQPPDPTNPSEEQEDVEPNPEPDDVDEPTPAHPDSTPDE